MSDDIRPLASFDYVAPGSIAEVLALLRRHGKDAQVLAGGTDLLPRMKTLRVAPRIVVDISALAELSFVELRENAIHIGAGTTLATLHKSGLVRERLVAFAQTLAGMSSPAIRNRATIGGNLCNGSRCADSPASLLTLDASVTLRSADSERTFPLQEFFTDRSVCGAKTLRKDDEIMTEIVVPLEAGESAFVKLGRRKGSSIGIASAAAFVSISNDRVERVRVAIGGIGSRPVRAHTVEASLKGKAFSEQNVAAAAAAIRGAIDPIDDLRASAQYRREMVPVLIKRALLKAANRGERYAG